MSEQNQTPKPRISLEKFEKWLVLQEPGWLLTPKAYLFCVDGCGPDEVCQRFGMVESISQRAGKTAEEIASWHKTNGGMYESDPKLFAEAVYAYERREKAAMTVLQFVSDVTPKKAEYLIPPYLPKGMLTVLGGVSGVGKTWLALHWAARVSHSFRPEEPGAVYYFTQENDPAIVLQPRLEALGADQTRVAIQRFDERASGLTLDDARIESAALLVPPKLVIFDPIQSYLGAGVEMNKANEVRPVLDWLGRFAQRYNCAVVLVSHMAKPSATNADALDRLLGSSDFRNAARSIVIVGRDPDDPEVRVFAHAKNSLGEPGASRRYRVGDSGVQLLDTCDLTANEIIRATARSVGRPTGSRAAEDLLALLHPRGWVTADEVRQLCAEKGYQMRTLQYAARQLGLKHMQTGGGATRKDWWLLPGTSTQQIKVG